LSVESEWNPWVGASLLDKEQYSRDGEINFSDLAQLATESYRFCTRVRRVGTEILAEKIWKQE